MKPAFKIKRVFVAENGARYATFKLTGWFDGRRIRKQFKNSEDAFAEKNLLEVRAAVVGADVDGAVIRE